MSTLAELNILRALLLAGDHEFFNNKASCIGTTYQEYLAQYALDRGVVVPPVNVGDKVWYISGGYYSKVNLKPKEIEVTEISKKKCGKTIDWAFIANATRYKFSSLGKTVFLTEQEAIEAINKRKKHLTKKV